MYLLINKCWIDPALIDVGFILLVRETIDSLGTCCHPSHTVSTHIVVTGKAVVSVLIIILKLKMFISNTLGESFMANIKNKLFIIF